MILLTDKKKFEFSKLIFFFVTFFIVLLTVFSFIMMWQTKDLTPLAYLIPAWFGEMSVVTGFYFNKAKAENIIKLKKYYHVDINDIKDV